MRATLFYMYDERAAGQQGGFMAKKDFSTDRIKMMSDYYQRTFYWPYLVSFQDTLDAVSDIADLWLREFYLEMTRRLQVRSLTKHVAFVSGVV